MTTLIRRTMLLLSLLVVSFGSAWGQDTNPISTKIRYKTLVANGNSWTPHLLGNWFELAGDCNVGRMELAQKLYVRWYLTDLEGNEIKENFSSWNYGGYYTAGGGHSYYRYKFTAGDDIDNNNQFNRKGTGTAYNPTFTLPKDMEYKEVRLVCVATTLTEGYPNFWNGDPSIQAKYIYTLLKQDDLKFFAHYPGEAYRYLMEANQPNEADKYNYATYGDGVSNQHTWDVSTNNYSENTTSDNIRQNAHTVDYYYYVTQGQSVSLLLPNQDYANFAKDSYDGHQVKGNRNEPQAYFRWYDYKTDMHSPHLAATIDDQLQSKPRKNSNQLKHLFYEGNNNNTNNSRGLFAIMFNHNEEFPSEDVVGVNFTAPKNFNEEFQIACDVSRYMDGMDDSFTHLVHEPTLSIRYLFHILPAENIAQEITDKANSNSLEGKTGLDAVEEKITNNGKPTLYEDEGRTVVSLNDRVGEFALRTRLSDLGHYYFYDASNSLRQAKTLWWYAYYKDAEGNWWKHLVPRELYRDRDGNVVKKDGNDLYRTQTYQAKYSLADRSWTIWNIYSGKDDVKQKSDFQDDWEMYEDGQWIASEQDFPDGFGMNSRVQMVACVSADDLEKPDNNIMPIIWTELEFINAKPLLLGTEKDEDERRTVSYMNAEYSHAETLDFNDVSLYGLQKPTTSYENYATLPLQFTNAQYGYCFPQLYGLCATMKNITYWEGFGFAPMHGDYTLLKSMNMPNISMDTTTNDDFNRQSFITNWVNDSGNDGALYDVTHERAHPRPTPNDKNSVPTETNDYGSFLYVDAADEARTIASLEFNAELCHGAKIYYTAYVASSTGKTVPKDQLVQRTSNQGEEYNKYTTPQTPPMLRFRVTTWDEEHEKNIPVVTFVTGNIKEEVNHNNSTNPFKEARWYQVYGHTTIPNELEYLLKDTNGNPKRLTFNVEIDNYCDNTDGADYCVDQISFYTSNARLQVMQAANRTCEDQGISLNIYVDSKELEENQMIEKPIYWRICDKSGNPLMDNALYGDFLANGNELADGTATVPFGKTTVLPLPTSTDNIGNAPKEQQGEDEDATYGYFKRKNDDALYFSLANKHFDLVEGANYYISVYELGEKPTGESGEEGWGDINDICTVFSPVFIPKMVYVSVSDQDGNINPTIEVACSDHVADLEGLNIKMVVNVPDDSQESGFYQSTEEIKFDFFIGTEKEYDDYYIKLEDEGPEWHLNEAIEHYRRSDDAQWTYNEARLHEEYMSFCEKNSNLRGHYKVIQKAVEDGLLYLLASNDVKLKLDTEHTTVLALAINKSVEDSQGIPYEICTPLPLTFNVEDNLEDPDIVLGFDDVEYKRNRRVVRVGLKQLENMQNKGYALHIPVNMHRANKKNENERGKLKIISEGLELLKYPEEGEETSMEGTNDPTVEKNMYVATFNDTEISENKQYISIKFINNPYRKNDQGEPESVTSFSFHEGYTYRMFFQVKNGDRTNDDPKACEGNVEFLLKVVPEYVTWNDKNDKEEGVTPNPNVNKNWNNDKNWSRSKKEELYKTDYQNNGKDGETGVEKTPAAFVPMKFTYVTIPSDNVAPKLVNLVKGAESDKEKGVYKDIYTNINGVDENGNPIQTQTATDSIEYDLMVRMEETCQDHDVKNENVYDCEKFYGNYAKEIYFKPRAELINQQFLTYEKAWVEKELEANRWYLMSTPLKETYAGDMYVPCESGRQETEAFEKITFDDTDTYSRTKYPIYQRSWGNWGNKESKVYTQSQNYYDASLSNSSTVELTNAEWGHTYNDLGVNYNDLTGFAIRAHKQDQTTNKKALIRLPKDDESYYYYDYKGEKIESGKVDVRVSKDGKEIATGKFIADKATETDDNATVTLNIADLQQVGGYVLVGNPYMASLDMEKFFEEDANGQKYNPDLTVGYHTYGYDEKDKVYKVATYGETTLGVIRPLEAFFVKVNNNATTITFTADMMIDGNNLDAATSKNNLFSMTASNNIGQSTAMVAVGDKAKSVETLFDSNLEDVPMVYTVADGQAVSINQLTELGNPIAFGVTCAASNELVKVAFSNIDQLMTSEVSVLDAVTGRKTTISEGSVLDIQPNDYGRYFLMAEASGIHGEVDTQKNIVISVRDKEVTVKSNEELTLVSAFSLSGATIYHSTAGGTTASFALESGIYIIKAENVAGEQQVTKIMVR